MCLTYAQADAIDLEKHSSQEFSFKVGHEKHTFKATSDTERDAWFASLKNAITEAKSSKEAVRNSDKYKESIKHLGSSRLCPANLCSVCD